MSHESVRVYTSSIIHAPLQSVWSLIRKFGNSPKWSSAIEESKIEEGRDEFSIGCIRVLKIKGSSESDLPARERLLALDEKNHSFTYELIQAGGLFGQFKNYVATISLRSVTSSDETFMEWVVEFEVPMGEREKSALIVRGAYEGGMQSLNNTLNQ